jgi:type IV secretory pathway TrbD component
MALSLIDPTTLYLTLNSTGEFMFRTETFFFYKGFIYLGISAIFFLSMKTKYSSVWGTIVIIALAMTLTRGFVLSTAFAAVLLLIAQRRWGHFSVSLFVIICALIFLWIYMPSQDDSIRVSRDISNNVRIEDFTYIMENVEVGTILMGEGLGTLINNRSGIENTLLWALWRLGIAGLLFWLLPLILCLSYFLKINRHSPQFRLACAYFFSTVLIYVQTMSNPYLNNPIGLSFVLVAIFSLRTLARADPEFIPIAGPLPLAVPAKARRAT